MYNNFTNIYQAQEEAGIFQYALDHLPYIEENVGIKIYDPSTADVRKFLADYWTSGECTLNVFRLNVTDYMGIIKPYIYNVRNHTALYIPANCTDMPVQTLESGIYKECVHHATVSGWVEIACNTDRGWIGPPAPDAILTAGYINHPRFSNYKFPDKYIFQNPPDRLVDLIFDLSVLQKMGINYNPRKLESDYYVFDRPIALQALIPTSKAYVEQVLDLLIPSSE